MLFVVCWSNSSTGYLSFCILDSAVMTLFAYVSLGSNLGDRAGNLLLAVRGMLDAGFVVTRLSEIYETEPVDVREQPFFLNMVAELRVRVFSPDAPRQRRQCKMLQNPRSKVRELPACPESRNPTSSSRMTTKRPARF